MEVISITRPSPIAGLLMLYMLQCSEYGTLDVADKAIPAIPKFRNKTDAQITLQSWSKANQLIHARKQNFFTSFTGVWLLNLAVAKVSWKWHGEN